MITCRECRERLNDLLDETSLSPNDAALRDLRAHVAGCAQCTHDLALLRAAQSELRAFPQVAAPAAVRSRVLAALQAEKAPAKRGFGAAFEAFLQRPQRLAWAGGALATACFLVLLARTPQVQESVTKITSEQRSEHSSDDAAAPAQQSSARKPENAQQRAAAIAKKPSTTTAPKSSKPTIARNESPTALPSIAPLTARSKESNKLPQLGKANRSTSGAPQEFQWTAKAPTKATTSAPALTQSDDNVNGIARGPLVPSVTVPTRRAGGQTSTPELQLRALPRAPLSSDRVRISESPQPGALGVQSPTGSAPATSVLAAPVPLNGLGTAPSAMSNNRIKMARPESDALATSAGSDTPSVAKSVPNTTLRLAVPPDTTQGLADTAPSGAQGASGASASTARMTKPNTDTANESVATLKGAGSTRGAAGIGGGLGNSYMMRAPQNVPNSALPGEAGTSGGGFGSKHDTREPLPAAKPTDEREEKKKLIEKQVFQLNATRILTFNFLPAHDWSAAQIRLVLPTALRFADGASSKVLWHGKAKRGQNISLTASLLAHEVGAGQLRLILEQSAGGTLLPVQTQTIAVDAVH